MIVYLWIAAGIFWVLGMINLFAYAALRKDLPKDRLFFLIAKSVSWFVMSFIGFYLVTRL